MLFDFESHTSITSIHKKYWFSSRWRRKQTKHANFLVGVQYPLKTYIEGYWVENLPEIMGCHILHPFSALDIFQWWQNLDFSTFVSYERGKSNCWHYPEIKEGAQVCKISHFEKLPHGVLTPLKLEFLKNFQLRSTPFSSLWVIGPGGPEPSGPCGDRQNATVASPPMPLMISLVAWCWKTFAAIL